MWSNCFRRTVTVEILTKTVKTKQIYPMRVTTWEGSLVQYTWSIKSSLLSSTFIRLKFYPINYLKTTIYIVFYYIFRILEILYEKKLLKRTDWVTFLITTKKNFDAVIKSHTINMAKFLGCCFYWFDKICKTVGRMTDTSQSTRVQLQTSSHQK